MRIGRLGGERRALAEALVLAFLAVLVFSAPTWANQDCKWFGTRPFCDGKCGAGYVYTGLRQSCTTGSRRFCCSATYVHPGKNCKWAGNEFSMLYVCDDTNPPKPPPPPSIFTAIAIDGKGRWGASIMKDGNFTAPADAMKRCGSGCKVVMQGPGRCVAFAQSKGKEYWVGFAHGDNRDEVQRIALKGCTDRAPKGTCKLEHVNCF